MKRQAFEIGGFEVSPGERRTIELPIAKLYTHTKMGLTVHVVHGRKPGPTLFVSAALHGDEINGVEIIRRLLKRKLVTSLRGTLIAIPIVNSFGFIHNSRYLPDRRDLNRMFPGSSTGSLAARIADLFMGEIANRSTVGIDLHTGSNNRFNLPHIRANLDDARTLQLARDFGAPVIVNAKSRDGSLRETVAELGIPVLLYEAGEALRFDDLSIRMGLRGIISVMRSMEMLPPKKSKGSRPVLQSSATKWVRAPISGILTERQPVGAQVNKGELLGVVSDPYGEESKDVYAPVSGVVLGRLELPLVHQGDALFHLGVIEGDPDAGYILEELTSGLQGDDYSMRQI